MVTVCPRVGVLGDEVKVKGTVLEGTIVEVTDSVVILRTKYGTGDLSIAYEDIEDL